MIENGSGKTLNFIFIALIGNRKPCFAGPAQNLAQLVIRRWCICCETLQVGLSTRHEIWFAKNGPKSAGSYHR